MPFAASARLSFVLMLVAPIQALMQAVPEPDPMLARERSAQRRLAAATAAKSGAAT